MTDQQARVILAQTREYLTGSLLPFWIERAPDPEHGGFLTHFDRYGQRTGATAKTFLMQIRMLYTMASAHRAGYGDGRCAEFATAGADFLLDHYWDDEHGGWFWIADRHGSPTDRAKIGYGQCFAMYAWAEYFLATGDPRGREAMLRTLDVVQQRMADPANGGYFEIMARDWRPAPPGRAGGDRKSFDVHMHMMEALTSVCEVTGAAEHRVLLEAVIDVLIGKMLDPRSGTGIQQFRLDFQPVPAIRFDVLWGRDEEPEHGTIPIEITSYGHNVEFAWLLLRAADTLGRSRASYAPIVERICAHCAHFGIDRQHGGVYIDGPNDAAPTNVHKQFWQQAEVLVGMLAAYDLLEDARYWEAFVNVHGFVFDRFIHRAGGGEWFAMLERDGTPIWDYLGDDWKISYHTVRSMIEVVRRLSARQVS